MADSEGEGKRKRQICEELGGNKAMVVGVTSDFFARLLDDHQQLRNGRSLCRAERR